MFRVTSSVRMALAALALTAAAFAQSARAADLAEYDPYARPHGGGYVAPGDEPAPPPRVYEERYRVRPRLRTEAPPTECRTVVRRRIDPYGRELIERRRVCDGVAALPPQRWEDRPRYRGDDYAERRPHHGPRYRDEFAPRPPGAVPEAHPRADLDELED